MSGDAGLPGRQSAACHAPCSGGSPTSPAALCSKAACHSTAPAPAAKPPLPWKPTTQVQRQRSPAGRPAAAAAGPLPPPAAVTVAVTAVPVSILVVVRAVQPARRRLLHLVVGPARAAEPDQATYASPANQKQNPRPAQLRVRGCRLHRNSLEIYASRMLLPAYHTVHVAC